MDEKTAKAFSTAVDKLDQVATRLEASAATFATQPPAEEQPAESPAGAISAEQFNGLKTALETLTQQFNTALDQPTGKASTLITGAVVETPEPVY